MFLGQKCRLELIISNSHLTPFVLTISRKNTNCKKYKTYKKYKSNDGVTWVRIVHVGKYWKYRDIDKNQFMFIRIYSLSELIIDSWPDKYLNCQPVFWPWPKMGLVGWYESLVVPSWYSFVVQSFTKWVDKWNGFWKNGTILEKCNKILKTGTSKKIREHLKDKHVITRIKCSLGVVYFEVHVCNFLILPPCSKSQQIIISFPGRFLYFCQNLNFQNSQVQILFYYSVKRKRWNFKQNTRIR